jgi:ATPase subunit of ABC transporter with duplicated ATPase domains
LYTQESVCNRVLELEDGGAYLHAIGGPGSYERFRELREERRTAQRNEVRPYFVCFFKRM